MIIRVVDGAVVLHEVEDLRVLHFEVAHVADAEVLGPTDGDHVWVPVQLLRELGAAETRDRSTWAAAFDGMIAYADAQGWVDAARSAVRVHIVKL